MNQLNEQIESVLSDQLNFCLKSFSKQDLQKWIFGYTLQVILSSLHIILNHETTEMLEVLTKCSDLSSNSKSGKLRLSKDAQKILSRPNAFPLKIERELVEKYFGKNFSTRYLSTNEVVLKMMLK